MDEVNHFILLLHPTNILCGYVFCMVLQLTTTFVQLFKLYTLPWWWTDGADFQSIPKEKFFDGNGLLENVEDAAILLLSWWYTEEDADEHEVSTHESFLFWMHASLVIAANICCRLSEFPSSYGSKPWTLRWPVTIFISHFSNPAARQLDRLLFVYIFASN